MGLYQVYGRTVEVERSGAVSRYRTFNPENRDSNTVLSYRTWGELVDSKFVQFIHCMNDYLTTDNGDMCVRVVIAH